MDRHCTNAHALASWLAGQPQVENEDDLQQALLSFAS
jgi:O-acetylhomoserine/O-acetylserine sulfhydrylase-like pyridoxal-dependent enzyme